MRDLVRKLTKAGELVLDFYAGTCFTVRACMLFDRQREFVGCDLDPEVLCAVESDPALTPAFQVLNLKWDISGSGGVEAAAKAFIDRRRAFLASKTATVWEIPSGLDALRVSFGPFLHFIPALCEENALYEMCRPISFSLWPPA